MTLAVALTVGLLLAILILVACTWRAVSVVIENGNRVLCDLALLHVDVLKLIQKGGEIMATNQAILDEIAAESTVADSILVLVQRLVAETDPAARQAILDGLLANRAKLDAAVLAGTPQAPPTP